MKKRRFFHYRGEGRVKHNRGGDFINRGGGGSVPWLGKKEVARALSFISKVSALNFLTFVTWFDIDAYECMNRRCL